MKDTEFYNNESTQYSDKRYPQSANSYTQFFFKRRLMLTKDYIKHHLASLTDATLLEVGCADGIVLREIEKDFPNRFKKMIGIDVAPKMIAEARARTSDSHTEYYVREDYLSTDEVELIIETGVVNYTDFIDELEFARDHLKRGGLYILSVAGKGSLLNFLKPEKEFKDFRTYKEYDQLIEKDFIVREVAGCGFFVPLLWRAPALARVIQPLLEGLFGELTPNLCHEKVYLLQKRV